MRIAIDAMGGDRGPEVVIAGALDALRDRPEISLALVGHQDQIGTVLSSADYPKDRVHIVHAPESIGMSESPAQAIRKKKNASIVVGTRLLKEGGSDAFVSAGNTGAMVASSLLTLGRLHGISRPAISTLWPTKKSDVVVLDVGANHECTPRNLLQFALMGSVYAEFNLGVAKPRVGLLNIGEEPSKGNDLVKEAYSQLSQESAINFIGNVEGRDVFEGAADVVVCDGFVGNVLLKFSESIYSFLTYMLRDAISQSAGAKLGALMMKGAFTRVRSELDYAEYGGAPLLGVAGVSIISHGKSSGRAIRNAVLAAERCVSTDINRRIESRLKEMGSNVANVS